MVEYQIVPYNREEVDLVELSDWFRRAAEEFKKSARHTSPEDRLQIIEKIDRLLMELEDVRDELRFQRRQLLDTSIEEDEGDVVGEHAVAEYESYGFLGHNAMSILQWGTIGLILGAAIILEPEYGFSCFILGTVILIVVVAILSTIKYDGVFSMMRFSLVRKTKRYRELIKAEKGLKRLSRALTVTKLRLYTGW